MRQKAVDISTFIDLVLVLTKPLLGDKSIDLIHNRNQLPLVYADEDRLEQILLNLIGNAIKFTKSGSITASAKVLSEKEVEITVADTGVGISEDKHKLIFESLPGKGSAFIFTLAIAEEQVIEDARENQNNKDDLISKVHPLVLQESDPDNNGSTELLARVKPLSG